MWPLIEFSFVRAGEDVIAPNDLERGVLREFVCLLELEA